MLQFPGMTDDDIKVFLVEAEEQLQNLEDGLLMLEQGGDDEEIIAQIFRAAHTLKGSSATLGHEKMAKLTHSMESVLDLVRREHTEVSPQLMDLFFECLDMLRVLNREIATAQDSGADIEGLNDRLLDVIECGEHGTGEADGDVARTGEAQAEAQAEAGGTGASGPGDVRIRVEFTPKCPMPSVRAYQVIDRLSVLGKVAYTEPALERIEAGEDISSVIIVVEYYSDCIDPIVEVAKDVPDVMSVVVLGVAPVGTTAAAQVEQAEQAAAAAGAAQAAQAAKVAEAAKDAQGASSQVPPEPSMPKANGSVSGAPASAAERATASATANAIATVASTVRVDVNRLDTLSNLVAELVIDRTHLAQLEARLADKHGGDELISELNRTSTHIGRLTTELQEAINKARMFPIDNVFKRFPRMMRDLAQKQGKEIDFIVEGEDTELDRSVSEEIGDPLIHLLRNSIGHGIETPEERVRAGKPTKGTVRLSAFHQENYIVIRVADDGRGIDPEAVKASAIRKGVITEENAARMSDKDAVNLVFAPGLSTAVKADDVSGRGVGMDIVRKNIEKLNGSITIDTQVGKGTAITVKLPLTLAIIRALLVEVDSKIYAIPLNSVEDITRIDPDEIRTVRGNEAILLRGEIVPLVWLEETLGTDGRIRADRRRRVFVVRASSHEGQVGLVVHSLVGEMEIVIKSLGTFVGTIPGVSGVTILGDGRVALICDVSSLVRRVVEERSAANE